MGNGEVTLLATGLGKGGLPEGRRFAQVSGDKLVFKGLVRGFGEHRLFLKDGQDTHGLKSRANNCQQAKITRR